MYSVYKDTFEHTNSFVIPSDKFSHKLTNGDTRPLPTFVPLYQLKTKMFSYKINNVSYV